jgi:L-fuculose-phosphate aldolase
MARPRRPAPRPAARKPAATPGRPARAAGAARRTPGARITAPAPALEPYEAPLSARTDAALRAALCAAGRRLYERDLIGAGEGNLSARLDEGTFLVTPSGVSKGDLDPDDLLVVDANGEVVAGRLRPSTELRMHLAAYAARPEIAAAVHAHPITAVALTVAGAPWPGDIVPEAAVTLGPVAITRFAVPGTADVPEAMAAALPGHDVLLLSRHGALTLGATVAEAVDRMETLERVARIALSARAFGGCTPIPPEEVDRVLAAAGRPPRGGR